MPNTGVRLEDRLLFCDNQGNDNSCEVFLWLFEFRLDYG